jgi:mono/diheme cytochrome c family protein
MCRSFYTQWRQQNASLVYNAPALEVKIGNLVRHMRTLRIVTITITAFLLTILILSYALVSSEGLSARKKPSNFEYAIANFALGLSIPSEAKKTRNPMSSDPQILAEARNQYMDHCLVCHAEDGSGKTKLSAGLSPDVPDLRAQHIQDLTDGEMFYIIKNGVRFTGMPGWNIGDEDIWRLVVLIRQIPNESSPQSSGKDSK